jgi:glycosyltransferase involved in cell wall biosynthesis
MKLPRLTVLLATCNQASYLTDALNSLREQTFPLSEFEVLVINDGSTDTTSEILRREARWIRLVERENRGLVATCNQGLHLARGRYFTRLDSDDIARRDWLATLMAALDSRPAACCAYPDRYELHEGCLAYTKADGGNICSLEACGTVFVTDTLRCVGGFRAFYWEEYDLYLRLRAAGEWLHVPLPLYTYRKHDAGMTHDPRQRIDGWRELILEWGPEVLRNAGHDPELKQVLSAYR